MKINLSKVTLTEYIGWYDLFINLLKAKDKLGEDISDYKCYRELPDHIEKIVQYWAAIADTDVSKLSKDEYIGSFEIILQLEQVIAQTKPISKFNHKGAWYFAPGENSAEATFGQAINCNKMMDDMESIKGGNLHPVPSVLGGWFLRKGEKFDEVDLEARGKEFEDLPVLKGVPAYFFLTSTNKQLEKDMLHFLRETPTQSKSRQELTS